MLWFTDHFSCIYFCRNWPLQRTVRAGLLPEWPEPCIKAPWCGRSRPDGKSCIRVEWGKLVFVKMPVTSRRAPLFSKRPSARCQAFEERAGEHLPSLPSALAVTTTSALESRKKCRPSLLQSLGKRETDMSDAGEGAGEPAGHWGRELLLRPAQTGFQEGVPSQPGPLIAAESVGLLSFLPALLLFLLKPTFRPFPSAKGLG